MAKRAGGNSGDERTQRNNAEAYLRRLVANYETKYIVDHDYLEAVVYLISRGNDCSAEVERIREDWKVAEQNAIKRAPDDHPHLSGKSISPRDQSDAWLDNFWPSQHRFHAECDAAVLRAVEWCDIGGFDDWWSRLAREFNFAPELFEDTIASGAWAFATSRSNFALTLFEPALSMAFRKAVNIQDQEGGMPWHVQTQEPLSFVGYQPLNDPSKSPAESWQVHAQRSQEEIAKLQNRKWIRATRLDHVAHLLFVSHRLGIAMPSDSMHSAAINALLHGQRRDGSWSMHREFDEPCIETTAAAMHALAVWKPHGYERALRLGRQWLKSVQKQSGEWSDAACPSPGYATVLVLDAIALAEEKTDVTYDCPSTRPNHAAAPSSGADFDLSAYVEAKTILLDYSDRIPGLNNKRLNKILEKNPDIKRHKPSKQRLFVHLADFDAYVKRQQASPDKFGQLDDYADSIQSRTEAIRQQKEQRGEFRKGGF